MRPSFASAMKYRFAAILAPAFALAAQGEMTSAAALPF